MLYIKYRSNMWLRNRHKEIGPTNKGRHKSAQRGIRSRDQEADRVESLLYRSSTPGEASSYKVQCSVIKCTPSENQNQTRRKTHINSTPADKAPTWTMVKRKATEERLKVTIKRVTSLSNSPIITNKRQSYEKARS